MGRQRRATVDDPPDLLSGKPALASHDSCQVRHFDLHAGGNRPIPAPACPVTARTVGTVQFRARVRGLCKRTIRHDTHGEQQSGGTPGSAKRDETRSGGRLCSHRLNATPIFTQANRGNYLFVRERAEPVTGNPRDFSSLSAQVGASVVTIAAVRPFDTGDDEDPEDLRADLLHELSPSAERDPPQPTAVRLRGCGVILSEDGYILTNAHVVSGSSLINVARPAGERYAARLVGIDRPTDLAVIKIEAANLPVSALGSSARLKAGEWVGAIGSPFGFEQSVVVGVVSAVERTVPGDEFHTPFIQTDLPLNPGNSGGPLFDSAGSVVGINTEVVVGENGNAGISFAIPIDLAARVATELMSAGHANRAYLGVAFQDVDGPLAQAFGLPASGVVIHTVAPESPAASAGLRVGDVVLALQGETIVSARQMVAAIAALIPGTVAKLTLWRDRGQLEVRVPVVSFPLERSSVTTKTPLQAAHATSALMAVHALSVNARHLIGTQGHLIVMALSEQAAASGVEVGDVLLAVGDRPLLNESDLQEALNAASGNVPLLIDRNGTRMFIAVPATGHVRDHTTTADHARGGAPR